MLGTGDRKGHQGARFDSSKQQQYSSGPEGQHFEGKKPQRTGSIYNKSEGMDMQGGGEERDNKSIGEVGEWIKFFFYNNISQLFCK